MYVVTTVTKSQITREEKVLVVQFIIGSGLTQAALKNPGKIHGNAKECTVLVKCHHTEFLSETQTTS